MGDREIAFAEAVDRTPKHVVASTLADVDWNAELLRGDLAAGARRLDADEAPTATREAVVAEQEPDRVRPPVHRWLWYALGGGLPARHSTWVLHDTTTRTWGLRHVARSLVQMAIPTVLVLALVPAGWALRLAVVGGGVFLGLIFSLAYMAETTEQRVIRAGYRAGTAVRAREAASIVAQREESARKRAAAAKRAARYRAR